MSSVPYCARGREAQRTKTEGAEKVAVSRVLSGVVLSSREAGIFSESALSDEAGWVSVSAHPLDVVTEQT